MVRATGNSQMSVVKWFLGIVLWFARIAEIIILWSLRQWAYFVALPCIGLVLLTKWVAFTLTKQITGLHLSLLGYIPQHHVNPLLSFGVAAAFLFVLAALAYSLRLWRALTLVGALMLLVALFAVSQTAFLHSVLLRELLDEEIQAKGAAVFSKRYLPTNAGSEASDAIGIKSLPTDTVWERFLAAWYFMGFGWYVTVAGGLCAFLYGVCRIPPGRGRPYLVAASAFCAILLLTLCSARPLLAHLAVVRGQEAESKGDPDRAIREYRRAMQLDHWFAINPDLYQRIGAIDYNFGRTQTFEYGIYYAELMVSENKYPAAIAEYERLMQTAGHTGFLKTRTFGIWNIYGMQLYEAGAVGVACGAWQSVLALDRKQWLAIYCLSTAYFNTGRYQESIDLIQGLLKDLADPQLRANLNSNMGDAYTRLGDYQHAHLAYRYSYFVDNILNWRALSSLVGS
jgi:tetratricopeptide (TPR) repeat protein